MVKNISLIILFVVSSNIGFSQIEQKLNVDMKKFNITCKVDTSVWRIVKYSEYKMQNPEALEFLSDTSINFYNGYILKNSNNIMNPPAIMIQSIKSPTGLTKDILKKQADTIILNNSSLFKMSNEQKIKNGNSKTFLEYCLNSSNYFDEELDAFIIQMKVPGINNEFNIIHSATFIEKGQMLTIKMIYLENSQLNYFNEFNRLLKTVKIK